MLVPHDLGRLLLRYPHAQDDAAETCRLAAPDFRRRGVTDKKLGCTEFVGACDPNCKLGPTGDGVGHYVQGETDIGYLVHYENDAKKATAPAREVHVTDQLDPNLDWTTYQVTSAEVCGYEVAVPPGSQTFTTTVPAVVKTKDMQDPSYPNCRPLDTRVDVEVRGEFNPATGEAKWHFVGRDPTTGAAGDFLPPNVWEDDPATSWDDRVSPQGEGLVRYSCKPKATAAAGTLVTNKASIVFDQNPPMETEEVFHTLDTAAPTSAVSALPASSVTNFTVSWTGSDEANGSGIAGYTIYVSQDGGPYQVWLQDTTKTSEQYVAEPGHEYRFYSEARDLVGHTEAQPYVHDAATTVGGGARGTFPAGTCMVSIPLVPTETDPKKCLGFETNKWVRWDPALAKYVAYAVDATHFTWFDASTPGKGYWARFAADTSVVVDGTPPSASDPYVISVDPGPSGGWVGIGCPRLTDVLWQTGSGAIQVRKGVETKTLAEAWTAGWCEDTAWGYKPGGAYELVRDPSVLPEGARDRLEPWQGYWFNASGPCELLLPAVSTSSAATSVKPARWQKGEWSMALRASAGGAVKAEAVVGQLKQARAIEGPPPFGDYVELTLVDTRQPLAVDLKDIKQKPAWTLQARTLLQDTDVTLSWPDLSRMPHEYRPVLTDMTTGERRYMRTTQAYTYRTGSEGDTRRFGLEMAAKGAYTLTVTGVVAAATGSGAVDVRVRLSAPATLDVEVLNIAGRRVGTVCHGKQCEAGVATLSWNGSGESGARLPGGRYIVRATARGEDGQQVSALGMLQMSR
jgi:hypothetical protein